MNNWQTLLKKTSIATAIMSIGLSVTMLPVRAKNQQVQTNSNNDITYHLPDRSQDNHHRQHNDKNNRYYQDYYYILPYPFHPTRGNIQIVPHKRHFLRDRTFDGGHDHRFINVPSIYF